MNITVPEDYIKGFIRANNTFLYQLVFDPIERKLIPLNAYEDDIDPETLSYAGRYPFWSRMVEFGISYFSHTFMVIFLPRHSAKSLQIIFCFLFYSEICVLFILITMPVEICNNFLFINLRLLGYTVLNT